MLCACNILLILEAPDSLLQSVGARVRALREQQEMSRRVLAKRSGVSERFLAQLEGGSGNISLKRFAKVAEAVGKTAGALLLEAESGQLGDRPIALLGVRGAGKSVIGQRLAKRLNREFIELDRKIELAAGLSLGEIFELHGEGYYRRLERSALVEVLSLPSLPVFATGGSIVSHEENWGLMAHRATTIWLKAEASQHWDRVIRQGDRRPMAENPEAFAELKSLLVERAPLYARATHTIDTSGKTVAEIEAVALAALG